MIRSNIAALVFTALASCTGAAKSSMAETAPAISGDLKSTAAANHFRPRVIVSSDFPPLDVIPARACKQSDPPSRCSDPDDLQSMVRFLLYSNEMDVEGLIASAGTFANVANKQNILAMLDRYNAAVENLRRHDKRYPTAARLKSVTWQGMDGSIGTESFAGGKYRAIETLVGREHDTEASEAIIHIVDKPDPRPVWILVWGGPREVAQALWKISSTRNEKAVKAFSGKLRLYIIGKQDYTVDWLLDRFPDLFVIISENNYMGQFWNMPGADWGASNAAWMEKHIREGRGPFGAAYPRSGWDPAVPGVWEGDTPSFLYLLSGIRGLSNPENPAQPSWGGQFVQRDPTRAHCFDAPSGPKAVYRWRAQVQADFAARTEWLRR